MPEQHDTWVIKEGNPPAHMSATTPMGRAYRDTYRVLVVLHAVSDDAQHAKRSTPESASKFQLRVNATCTEEDETNTRV